MGKMRGTAKVGKHTLVYDAYALHRLEGFLEVKGVQSLVNKINDMGGNPGFGDILGILAAGMTDANPDADLKDASNLINEVGLEEATAAAMNALRAAFPDADEGEVGNAPKKKPRGRGKTS